MISFFIILLSEYSRFVSRYGEKGLEQGFNPNAPRSIFDLFNPEPQPDRTRRKGPPLVHKLPVTLEDLYNGKTQKLRITHDVICPECSGRGTNKPGVSIKCQTCNGTGVRVMIRQLGPGMMQQTQGPCPECRGTGKSVPDSDKCTTCNGTCVVSEKKIIEVYIDPGSPDGRRIPFEGEGNQDPDTLPGDIIVQLVEQPHPIFTRKGSDLHMVQHISLSEALCGFNFYVRTLSSEPRVLHVKSDEGDVIKPDDIRTIPQEGMPLFRESLGRGNLIIHFKVDFPEKNTLAPPQLHALSVIFNKPKQPTERDDQELHVMVDPATSAEFGGSGPYRSQAAADSHSYDDDDQDSGPRGQQVNCVQQ